MQHDPMYYLVSLNARRNQFVFQEREPSFDDCVNALITIIKFATKLGIYLIPLALVWLYVAALVHQAHSLWP
jgi:hypothetical protein